MNDVFMGKDWDEIEEELINSLKFIRGLYSSDVKEEEKIKKHLKKQVTEMFNELYKTVRFNNESERLILEYYGKKGEEFLNGFRADKEKAVHTTIKDILSVIDEKDSLFKNYNKTLKNLKKVLEKREKAFDEMLSSRAGQMLRYMLLWDCEKSGYTRYQFVTEGDNCEECSSLDGQVFDIKDAKSGINLAPMHPNCDCGAAVLDKNGGVVMMVGGKDDKTSDLLSVRVPNDAKNVLNKLYWARTILYKKYDIGDRNIFTHISKPEEVEDRFVLSSDDYKLVKVYVQLYQYFNTFGDVGKRDAVYRAIVKLRQKDKYNYKYTQTDSKGVYLDNYNYSYEANKVNIYGVVMSEGYAYSMGGESYKNDLFKEIVTEIDETKVFSLLDKLRDFTLELRKQRKYLKKGDIHISIRKYYADTPEPYWSNDNIFFNADTQVMFWEKN